MPASEIQNGTEFKTGTSEPETSTSHFPRRRIAIFLVVIPTIFLVANWFVFATWNHFWGYREMPVWEIAPPLLSLAFVACMILGRRGSNPLLRFTYRISAVWLGILNFSFFAAWGAWIVAGLAALFPIPVESKWIAVAFAGSALIASIYGLANAAWLRVTRVTVRLKNLPAGWQGRSVALVTDMHLGNVRGAGFTRRIVGKLQKLQPAAVFISGDMFDGVEGNLDAFVAPWKTMNAPAGVYYVSGNHEEFEDRSKFLKATARAGIHVLNNEKIEIDGLQIVGIHDGETDDAATYRSLLQRAEVDRGRASILLAHQPANLAVPATEGISLQLSGHTHGGQIWPWNNLAARVHGKFVHGLNRFDDMQVFTSYGAGTWGVPMRAATKSEIVMIRLEPESPAI